MGISNFERHLAQVDPEDVLRYSSGSGLKEAKSAFSKISQGTVGYTKAGSAVAGGRNPYLLGSSTKLEHNKTSGIRDVLKSHQTIQYLQAAGSSGLKIGGALCNTCGSESKGCSNACLGRAGQLGLTGGEVAKQSRTAFAIEEPAMYLGMLHAKMNAQEMSDSRKGMSSVFRLNGTSDVGWHRIPAADVLLGMRRPGTMFNEYTKFNTRDVVAKEDPIKFDNYHIIHSMTEHTTVPRIQQITSTGRNVAVPFNVPKGFDFPDTAVLRDRQGRSIELPIVKDRGRSVGDLHDMRHLDEKIGGIVALRAKEVVQDGRRGVFDKSGFIRNIGDLGDVTLPPSSAPSSRFPQSTTPVSVSKRRSR